MLFTDKGESVLGVVYHPSSDELYLAVKDLGSYINGIKVNVRKDINSLNQALVGSEFGYERVDKQIDRMLGAIKGVLMNGAHGVRMIGSGVLALLYVGCGRLDCIYSGVAGEGWKPWDYAAASLFITEAGGFISKIDGSKFDLFGDSVLAASSELLKQDLIQAIRIKLN
jgi:fructose-1,6-bisphosphatase/inositol monophosphatase family enzyme